MSNENARPLTALPRRTLFASIVPSLSVLSPKIQSQVKIPLFNNPTPYVKRFTHESAE